MSDVSEKLQKIIDQLSIISELEKTILNAKNKIQEAYIKINKVKKEIELLTKK